MRKLRVFMGLLLITLLTQSCAFDPSSGRAELKSTGEANIHAISDERIRVLMQNLKAQTFNRYDSALESEKEQSRYYGEIADIAKGVSRSAKSVAFLGLQQSLSKREQKDFQGLADRLGRQAGEIKRLANSGKDRALRNKMNQMIGTCNSCHDSFRAMPGGVK